MYRLKYSTASRKYFKKINEKGLKKSFENALKSIQENPYIGKPKKGDLSGIYGYDVFYNKTNYELAYRVRQLDDLIIIVIMAGTRENFYEELKRYIRTI